MQNKNVKKRNLIVIIHYWRRQSRVGAKNICGPRWIGGRRQRMKRKLTPTREARFEFGIRELVMNNANVRELYVGDRILAGQTKVPGERIGRLKHYIRR